MDYGNGLCKTRPAQRFEKYAAFIIRQAASATFLRMLFFLYPLPGNDHVCTGQLFIICLCTSIFVFADLARVQQRAEDRHDSEVVCVLLRFFCDHVKPPRSIPSASQPA